MQFFERQTINKIWNELAMQVHNLVAVIRTDDIHWYAIARHNEMRNYIYITFFFLRCQKLLNFVRNLEEAFCKLSPIH